MLAVCALVVAALGSQRDKASAVARRSVAPATLPDGSAVAQGVATLAGHSGERPHAPRAPWGHVVSLAGQPLSHASLCPVDLGRQQAPADCVQSDARGAFQFDGSQRAGSLLVSAPGYLTRSLDLSELDAERGSTISLLRAGVSVSGRVRDATGGLVVGAVLSVRSSSAAPVIATGVSDLDGHFELGVASGSIELSARADGYSVASLRVTAPATGLVLALVPAAVSAGRVVEGSGLPVAGVWVTATPAHGSGSATSRVQTDAAGSFLFQPLAAGDYELVASGPDWKSESRWVSLGAGGASEPILLTVAPATTLSGSVKVAGQPCLEGYLELSGPTSTFQPLGADGTVRILGLLPGRYQLTVACSAALAHTEMLDVAAAPITRRWQLAEGLRVQGQVRDASGQPVSEVTVQAQPEGAPLGRSSAACVTDRLGEFSCAGLDSGEYGIGVQELGSGWQKPVPVVLGAQGVSGILLQLSPSGSIRVTRASASASGPADTPVFARAIGSEHPWWTQAVQSGEELVFQRLPLARYQLFVGSPSAARAAAEVTLQRDGQIETVSLPAPDTTFIAGRVLDVRGEPVVDAWVQAWPAEPGGGGLVSERELTQSGGEFRLDGLLPGSYDLRVSGGFGSGELRRVPGGSTDVTLRWEALAELAGSVETREGAPVPLFSVSCQGSDGRTRELPGALGRWQPLRLEPGQYALTIHAPEGQISTQVSLAAGARQSVALRLRPHESAAAAL